jgi:hypothetical protein
MHLWRIIFMHLNLLNKACSTAEVEWAHELNDEIQVSAGKPDVSNLALLQVCMPESRRM